MGFRLRATYDSADLGGCSVTNTASMKGNPIKRQEPILVTSRHRDACKSFPKAVPVSQALAVFFSLSMMSHPLLYCLYGLWPPSTPSLAPDAGQLLMQPVRYM